MAVDTMFALATAAFAFGLSLASYRWFALQNGWPMGEWQARRPGLPIAIGVLSMLLATLFALARGDNTLIVLPLLGVFCALTWTALTRVGAQSALLLAPVCTIALLIQWLAAIGTLPASQTPSERRVGEVPPVDARGADAVPSQRFNR